MRTRLFISYSHEDSRWLERVSQHLGVLEREGLLEAFEDTRIGVGEDWFARLHEEMKDASIALLLISSAFLTSSFIRKEEIPTLFEKHMSSGMVVYPLLVRDCAWQQVGWLSRLQMRPRQARALASMRGGTLDTCLADVAREIAELVKTPDLKTQSGRQQLYREFDERLEKAPPDEQFKTREFYTRKWLEHDHRSVSDLKKMFGRLSYYKGPMDETFDRELAGAIVQFQKEHRLNPVDGICGEMCLGKLRELLGSEAGGEERAGTSEETVEVAVAPDKRGLALTMIHETGKPRSYTACYDNGGDLWYGQCFVSLQRGSLYTLAETYSQSPGARFSTHLQQYLPQLKKKDSGLVSDDVFKGLLSRIAGEDPVMLMLQDQFLDQHFLGPARQECSDIGIRSALGFALIADSFFQHGRNAYGRIKLATIKALDGTPVTGINEQQWLRRFAKERIASAAGRPFAGVVEHRTLLYVELMKQENWNLASPLRVHGYVLVDP